MSEPTLSKSQARRLFIHAQRLDSSTPFGRGVSATTKAVEHLGYVQIDTINVIERCHHHILFNRIPGYRTEHLHAAQAIEKTVFEYWTHALSYIPTRDFKYFMPRMDHIRDNPSTWFRDVSKTELRRVVDLVAEEGPVSIRDIDTDILVDKKHPWGSRKPSKKALELAFYSGELVISERLGMLKKYEITDRHFGWAEKPEPATEREINRYLLNRALRSQAFVSLDSVCYLNAKAKAGVKLEIESGLRSGELIQVKIEGVEKINFYMRPEIMDLKPKESGLVHILSPFDPLIIQRKRLKAVFDYEHRFEAYLPKEKRKFGYFALPVLSGDKVVALLDLKTDRSAAELLIQSWHWLGKSKSRELKRDIEEALEKFERFQLRS